MQEVGRLLQRAHSKAFLGVLCRVALLGGTCWEEGPEYARGRQLKVYFMSALHEMLLINSSAPSVFKKVFLKITFLTYSLKVS